MPLLDDTYRLECVIGRGGMGVVWLARDVRLDRVVAIKQLSRAFVSEPEFLRRFEREARVMASVSHPNLVPIHHVGQVNGLPYLVMQALQGSTLGARLNRGALPIAEVLGVGGQVCSALECLHAAGVIHRDVKPGNVFLGEDGRVTLLDFGVARVRDSDLTRTGVVVGTARYVSPEQILGEPCDHRADLYSLGVVLFEACTGRALFEADSDLRLLRAHVEDEPRDPSTLADVPPELAAIILRALAKQPRDRFLSAAEFRRALESCPPLAPSRTRRKNAAHFAIGASLGLVLVGALVAGAFTLRPGRSTEAVGTARDGEVTQVTEPASPAEVVAAEPRPEPTAPAVELAAEPRPEPTAPAAAVEVAAETRAKPTAPAVERAAQPRTKPPAPAAARTLTESASPAEVAAAGKRAEPTPSWKAAVVTAEPRERSEPAPPTPQPVLVAEAPHAAPPTAVRPGRLQVTTLVGGALSWAWVEIDGERIGQSPRTVSLPAGKHVVRLLRDERAPVSREVTVEPGAVTTLVEELQP